MIAPQWLDLPANPLTRPIRHRLLWQLAPSARQCARRQLQAKVLDR